MHSKLEILDSHMHIFKLYSIVSKFISIHGTRSYMLSFKSQNKGFH